MYDLIVAFPPAFPARACDSGHVGGANKLEPVARAADKGRSPGARDAAEPFADFLCFDLYAAQRAVTAVYRAVLEPLGLTYPQYLVLVLLWQRGTVTARDVIDELQLGYGTVSPLLKRLEARGLVQRRRRTDDERSIAVTLTESGRALEARREEIARVIAGAVGLDPAAARALHDTLAKVEASARAALSGLTAEPGEVRAPQS